MQKKESLTKLQAAILWILFNFFKIVFSQNNSRRLFFFLQWKSTLNKLKYDRQEHLISNFLSFIALLMRTRVQWPIYISFNSTVFNGRLPFWEDGSRPSDPFSNLPFWDDPDLNVRYLWVFQVDQTFYKLDMKIVAPDNEIRCVRCSWPLSSTSAWDPCQQKHLLF